MTGVDLLASTDDALVDGTIRSVVGIFEMAFPERVRGYYLKGSYASSTAVATSDVDMEIVFKGTLREPELTRAEQLTEHCRDLSRLPLDVGTVGEASLITGWAVDIKLATVLVHGDDIRALLPLRPAIEWARHLVYGLPGFMARVRGLPRDGVLRAPVSYPHPEGTFFGYDTTAILCRDGMTRPGLKDFVRIVLGAASGIASLRSRSYVTSKREAVSAYRQTIGDGWADYVEAVDRRCRAEWAYLVPSERTDQEALRDLCRRGPEFENHFLTVHRELALQDLLTPPEEEAWVPAQLAAHLLGCAPEDVAALVAAGDVRGDRGRGEVFVRAASCAQVRAAQALTRVRYAADPQVQQALRTVAESAPDNVTRRMANEALRSVR